MKINKLKKLKSPEKSGVLNPNTKKTDMFWNIFDT